MSWTILISGAIGWVAGWATVRLVIYLLERRRRRSGKVYRQVNEYLDRQSKDEVEFLYPNDLKEAFDRGLIKNVDDTIP